MPGCGWCSTQTKGSLQAHSLAATHVVIHSAANGQPVLRFLPYLAPGGRFKSDRLNRHATVRRHIRNRAWGLNQYCAF
jgi:hypothetical protein